MAAAANSSASAAGAGGGSAAAAGLKTYFKTPEGRYKLQYEKTHSAAVLHYNHGGKTVSQVSSLVSGRGSRLGWRRTRVEGFRGFCSVLVGSRLASRRVLEEHFFS